MTDYTNPNKKRNRREMTYTQGRKNDSDQRKATVSSSTKKKSASVTRSSSGSSVTRSGSGSSVKRSGSGKSIERSGGISTSYPAKKKPALTPEERRRLEAQRSIKQVEKERRQMKAMEQDAKEKARLRKERQRKAAEKRKKQLILRCVLLIAAVIVAIIAAKTITKSIQKKKLEPESGAGTNILQAAEEAVEGNSTGSITPSPTPTATPEPTPMAETASSNSLSLCMVGDVILHQRVLDASATDSGYDFNNLFANVSSEVQKYDIKIVNQETILGGPALGYEGYPTFNSPFEEADAIVNAGFNVVLHATNHTLDKGQPAVQNCLNYWNTTYPQNAVLGIHDDNEPSQDIYVFEKNGIRVAILNYTYGTNKCEEEVASGELANEVNFLDIEKVQNDVARAREMADYIVVCPHWGVENEFEYNSEQDLWTSYFLEWGVNLVIGTHPHVIQPIEKYTRSDGHEMLVYYSLGNFLSNQNDRFGNVGAMAQVIIKKNDAGQVVTDSYGVRTLVCHESRDGEAYTSYFLEDYSEEMAANNDVLATDPEFSYSYCCELRDQIFGGLGSLQVG